MRQYTKADIAGISLGYDKIRDMNIEDVENILNDSGMNVSSLILTGFYTLSKEEQE